MVTSRVNNIKLAFLYYELLITLILALVVKHLVGYQPLTKVLHNALVVCLRAEGGHIRQTTHAHVTTTTYWYKN